MTIQLTAPILEAGVEQATGTQLTLSADREAELVNRGVAVYVGDDPTRGGLTPLLFDVERNVAVHPTTGGNISVGLRNKSVWYRLRQYSGGPLVDAMGNGPDIPLVDTTGTPNVWANAKWATPPNDGTGKASTYARVIGNAYLNDLCAIETLIASQGLLFFAADIYPATTGATVDKTQTIFMMGAGVGNDSVQAFTMSQHIATGVGRVRICDKFDGVTPNVIGVAESAALTAGARSALCGYIDTLNNTVAVSLNGGAFTTAAIDFSTGNWNDAEAQSFGFCMLALNPESAVGATPVQFMGGSAATLGTRCSGLFITRFDTHPGLDFVRQLAVAFSDAAGVFPDDLRTGKY
ncbi:hypothetical protein [Thiobacillus sp. 65-1402]|uniref:hypothetical protein n=1 Tax=Thiobacillus sp. 65-1402 TaxID=1895861 RepID=UPI0009651EC8|nr:hypothetical protein [Thiobacillus sp. 65-1402]OJW77982.1 MAG: hypothetical protein BGO62_10445 [Thiobacillus sp. 65-1402]